ncbi:hypothetical protein [Thermomonospora umbrina]|uniref:Uncharacterized protein n=1 Tax=Thermomonospora umbrina TaxID=111806 RepID=A0A3D9STB8_9ACTN|nr:hypothetical protein [Thermomonospora umbrina]REE96215.1 hypothetical protein DFJ69_1642 [Thermomonospora umbrina]
MRDVQGTEVAVLNRLVDKVEEIVDAAGAPGALAATQVLDAGFGFQPADYTVFGRRFALLHRRLVELNKAGKVVVNPDLPDSVGAQTLSAVDEAHVQVQLGPGALRTDAPESLTLRALTLIHELSHALREHGDHPVKDYTYRNSWGQGYLAGEIGTRNADTYFEAAAHLAEQLEKLPAGIYRERGLVQAQRRALQPPRPVGNPLGPALAWADIKLNRIWLRAYDAQVHVCTPTAVWDRRSGEDVAAMQQVEARLQELGILDGRSYWISREHGPGSVAAARLLEHFTSALKSRLMRLRVVLGGDVLRYDHDPVSGSLLVPFETTAEEPLHLAGLIIDALLQGSPIAPPAARSATPGLTPEQVTLEKQVEACYPGAAKTLSAHLTEVVELLWVNDRSYERPQVQGLEKTFAAFEPVAVGLGSRGILQTVLRAAEIDDLIRRWTIMPARLGTLPAPALVGLTIFDDVADEQLRRIVDLAGGLAAPTFFTERPSVRAGIGRVIAAVTELATGVDKAQATRAATLLDALGKAADGLA